ncbi:transposase [Nitrosomonas communis]|uniref:transposase n=1 Tax=Nitrosomonas communis TaxID=44574 RepID=UPI003D2CB699
MSLCAKSWKRTRRIIVKIEHTDKDSHPYYVANNLIRKPQFLYDKLYCARGEM